jgi:hypothetical protein
MFVDDFLNTIPDDPADASFKLITMFAEFDLNCQRQKTSVTHYEDYLGAFGICQAFVDTLDINVDNPELTTNKDGNIDIIRKYFQLTSKSISERKVESTTSKVRDILLKKYELFQIYEFSDGDLKKIQSNLNELRDIINNTDIYEGEHKQRILNKLERLQMELHKKMPSLDKLWGLFGDAGVAMGKFGDDAKPFFDRVKEILQIVWRTQARAEELPTATPLPLLSNENPEGK